MRIMSSWCTFVNVRGVDSSSLASPSYRGRENPGREPELVPLSEAPLMLAGPVFCGSEALVPAAIVPGNAEVTWLLDSPERLRWNPWLGGALNFQSSLAPRLKGVPCGGVTAGLTRFDPKLDEGRQNAEDGTPELVAGRVCCRTLSAERDENAETPSFGSLEKKLVRLTGLAFTEEDVLPEWVDAPSVASPSTSWGAINDPELCLWFKDEAAGGGRGGNRSEKSRMGDRVKKGDVGDVLSASWMLIASEIMSCSIRMDRTRLKMMTIRHAARSAWKDCGLYTS